MHTYVHKVSPICRLTFYLRVAFHLQLCPTVMLIIATDAMVSTSIITAITEPLNLAYYLYWNLNMMCHSLIGYPGDCVCVILRYDAR